MFWAYTHTLTNQKRGECTRRHIKASVGQAVRLKQDVPLFLACVWNSVSSRAGLWLLSLANGERAQADKAEGICSTFHRPFKQHSGSHKRQVVAEVTATMPASSWDGIWKSSAAEISCGLNGNELFQTVRLSSHVSSSSFSALSGPAGRKPLQHNHSHP